MFRNLLSDQNVLSCIYRFAIVVNGGCYCCVACVFGWKSVKDIQRQGEGDGGSIVKVLQYVFRQSRARLQRYLSKQRSTFLPLLNSIAACTSAPVWERQVNHNTVSTIVLLYLLALHENQEVVKPGMHNYTIRLKAAVTAEL